MCIVPRISHFYENRSVPLKSTGGCDMGPYDYNSLCLEGILLIHHRLFPEDLCSSLIFITKLICMRTGYLFRRDSLDPDVCFLCEVIISFVTLHLVVAKWWWWQRKDYDLRKGWAPAANRFQHKKTLFPCKFIWYRGWGKGNQN